MSEDNGSWLPAPRYQGEQSDLEAELRRIVALTRENEQRRAILERRLRDRLNGYTSMPAGEWLEQADSAREQANGSRTYPPEWAELAAQARQLPSKGRPRKRRQPGQLLTGLPLLAG